MLKKMYPYNCPVFTFSVVFHELHAIFNIFYKIDFGLGAFAQLWVNISVLNLYN